MSDRFDQRELHDDPEETVRAGLAGFQRGVWTSLPVIVVEDSQDGHTVKIKSAVKVPRQKEDGAVEFVELPQFHDVPIHFQGAGGITATHAIKEGDEGIVHFSSRALDTWHEQGGVQQSIDVRMHSLSDGMFVPGIRSKPRKLKGVSKSSSQVRSDDKRSIADVSHTAVTAVREKSAHQTNGQGVLSQHRGSTHFVDASTIQNVAGKILLNC